MNRSDELQVKGTTHVGKVHSVLPYFQHPLRLSGGAHRAACGFFPYCTMDWGLGGESVMRISQNDRRIRGCCGLFVDLAGSRKGPEKRACNAALAVHS